MLRMSLYLPALLTALLLVGCGGGHTADTKSGEGKGKTYDVHSDLRVMAGEYVAEDGSHHQGTFAFF